MVPLWSQERTSSNENVTGVKNGAVPQADLSQNHQTPLSPENCAWHPCHI